MASDDIIWLGTCEAGWTPLPPPSALGHETFVSGDASGRRLSVSYFRSASDDSLVAKAVFGHGTQGPPGHAHGGSMAALLDEAMGFAAWAQGLLCVAVELNVKFRNMLPLGSRSVVHARVVSVDGRKVKTEGAISDQSGNVIADGTALFLTLDPTKFGQLASEASARLKREDSAI